MSIEHTYTIAGEIFTKKLTKAKAIRAYCLDCCSGYQGEVLNCTVIRCPLFPFRFGNEKGLERVGHLSPELADLEYERKQTRKEKQEEKSYIFDDEDGDWIDEDEDGDLIDEDGDWIDDEE